MANDIVILKPNQGGYVAPRSPRVLAPGVKCRAVLDPLARLLDAIGVARVWPDACVVGVARAVRRPIDQSAYPDNHENLRGMVDVYGQVCNHYVP